MEVSRFSGVKQRQEIYKIVRCTCKFCRRRLALHDFIFLSILTRASCLALDKSIYYIYTANREFQEHFKG